MGRTCYIDVWTTFCLFERIGKLVVAFFVIIRFPVSKASEICSPSFVKALRLSGSLKVMKAMGGWKVTSTLDMAGR